MITIKNNPRIEANLALSDEERDIEEAELEEKVRDLKKNGTTRAFVEQYLTAYASDRYLKRFPCELLDSEREKEKTRLQRTIKVLKSTYHATPSQIETFLSNYATKKILCPKDCPCN